MGNCFEVETNPAPRTTYGTNKNEARPPVIVPLVASGASKHTNKNEARPASRHTTSVKKKRNTEVNSGLTLGNVGIEGNGGCGGGNDSGGGGGGSGGGGGGYGGGGGCYDGGGGGGGGCAGGF